MLSLTCNLKDIFSLEHNYHVQPQIGSTECMKQEFGIFNILS